METRGNKSKQTEHVDWQINRWKRNHEKRFTGCLPIVKRRPVNRLFLLYSIQRKEIKSGHFSSLIIYVHTVLSVCIIDRWNDFLKTVKDRDPLPIVRWVIGWATWGKMVHQTMLIWISLDLGCIRDKYKPTFKTRHGLFEFKVLPFGLTNSLASFQGPINSIFAPC
jgi:hypothetical protein